MISYFFIICRVAKEAISTAMSLGARKRCSEFDRLGDEEAGKIAVEAMHTVQVMLR